MFNIILSVGSNGIRFPDVANPEFLTLEITFLVVFILLGFLWAGVALRSIVTMTGWFFMAIFFVFAIILQISFLYFWLATGITSMLLTISVLVYVGGDRI